MTTFDTEIQPKKSSALLPWLLFVLTLLLAGVGGYYGYGMLSAARDEAARHLKASQDAESRVKALEEEKRGLEGRIATLEGEKGMLQGEVQQKEAELAKLKATYDNLEEKMKEEIAKGEIQISQSGGRIQVDLVDKILFDSGSADLSPRGIEVLTRVGAVLAKVEDKQIQVSGHTDNAQLSEKLKEKFATNWELSTARAVNVLRFLSEKAGVPTKRLYAAGYGEFHPVASNANPEGRARNRRIEILLTPLLDAKPGAPIAVEPAAEAAAAKAAVPAKASATKGGNKKPARK